MMKSRWFILVSGVCVIALGVIAPLPAEVSASQSILQASEESPFVILSIPSITQLLSACKRIFKSVDRQDLAESLDQRLSRYNGFSGINKDRPLGIAWNWEMESHSHVVFLPVTNIDELLQTITFKVVGFDKLGSDRYEIRKVGTPYQVCVRSEYAYISEATSTIASAQKTADRIKRLFRDQYDLSLHLDLLQIPKRAKVEMANRIKHAIQPELQARDDESPESANLRRTLGTWALDLFERLMLDTSSATVGASIDPESGILRFEVVIEAVPKSRMANVLNSISLERNAFAIFCNSNAVASMTWNTSTSGGIQKLLGTPNGPAKNSRLDGGLQLMGERLGNLSLILAVSCEDVAELNKSLPQILVSLEQSNQIEQLAESFDDCEGVLLHSLIPTEIPRSITDWISSSLEIIVGQGDKTLWLGIGSPESLLGHLRAAIELVADSDVSNETTSPASGEVRLGKLPEMIASNMLIPNMDATRIREELATGGDRMKLKVELINNGMKVALDFEEGFTRLIGRDWIRQVESMIQN